MWTSVFAQIELYDINVIVICVLRYDDRCDAPMPRRIWILMWICGYWTNLETMLETMLETRIRAHAPPAPGGAGPRGA